MFKTAGKYTGMLSCCLHILAAEMGLKPLVIS